MTTKTLVAVLALFAILGMAVPASSQGGVQPVEPLIPWVAAEKGEMVDETPALWFVELASPPAVDGTDIGVLEGEKAAFRAEAMQAGVAFVERYAFDTLWNGLSVEIEPSQFAALARLPGVQALYPVLPLSVPKPVTGRQPDLFSTVQRTGADIAQSELGYSGEGIQVALIDTGIDYDHSDLGGCYGEGCRVAGGYDLVGDDFDGSNTPLPDQDPDDCLGHGTHLAGIIGADGRVTGVAPGVTLGAYRVFGCEGYTTADIVLAAMERALGDGMDVLHVGLSAGGQWPQYPTAQASDRLVEQGIVVVAPMGDGGASGLYAAGAPALGEKVIAVASFDPADLLYPIFEVAVGRARVDTGYQLMTYSAPPPPTGTEEIVWIGRACDGDALEGDPGSKVALATRGACSFAEKARNAQDAGATAIVIHNNAPGIYHGSLEAPLDPPFIAVSISEEQGMEIRSLESPAYITWTGRLGTFPSPTGGLISPASAYGLSPDLALKPDIGAVGGNTYSTYPQDQGRYATLDGVSASSAQVAGGVALLMEARPDTSPQGVRDILQNTADPQLWSLAPGYGFVDHVHRQGAGLLDIDEALLAQTRIEPGKLSLGEGEAGFHYVRLAVENLGAQEVTYDLSFENALSTGGVNEPTYYLSDAAVQFSSASVTVPAGREVAVRATIYLPTGPSYGQYGGYIVFTPQDGGQIYRVPFAGFAGDYQAVPALEPGWRQRPDGIWTNYGFPWLAARSEGRYQKVAGPGNWTFTLQDGDVPYFLVHFGHQAAALRIEIHDAGSGRPSYLAYEVAYLPRNSATTGFYAFPWDGLTLSGNQLREVPDGRYHAVVEVLKALGDEENSDHWETWTSPAFVIDRP